MRTWFAAACVAVLAAGCTTDEMTPALDQGVVEQAAVTACHARKKDNSEEFVGVYEGTGAGLSCCHPTQNGTRCVGCVDGSWNCGRLVQ